MSKKILITGITGFIGSNVLKSILSKKYDITAIVRPNTETKRYEYAKDDITVVKIDLTDIHNLRNYLKNHKFDIFIHIGALRGGRNFSKADYYAANVKSTEQLILSAMENNTKLIFCSSVGVFGAIPNELPAGNLTEKRDDNYYHYTKIQSEALIQKYVLYGLKAVIIRPSVTYGINDYGFPYKLIHFINKNILFLPDSDVLINLTNVELLKQAFKKVVDSEFPSGTAFIVADKNPVGLHQLANFISKELKNRSFPHNRLLPITHFRIGEKIAKSLKNELWISRFELLSRNWFYKTEFTYKQLGLQNIETIPAIRNVINWYKGT